MQECTRNLEVMYLIGKLVPDFRTIADFRKDNPKALKPAKKRQIRQKTRYFSGFSDSLWRA